MDLDNFYDSGDVSGNGWVWSVAGRESDWTVKSIMLNYAGRGFSYDAEGTNRNVNVGYPELAQRMANSTMAGVGTENVFLLADNIGIRESVRPCR